MSVSSNHSQFSLSNPVSPFYMVSNINSFLEGIERCFYARLRTLLNQRNSSSIRFCDSNFHLIFLISCTSYFKGFF